MYSCRMYSFVKVVFITTLSGAVFSESQLNRHRVLDIYDDQRVCEPITEVTVCTKVGYNATSFPNYRNQPNQQEANAEIMQFSPLIQAGCSNALVHLLCAIYVPFCYPFDPVLRIPPCRELCEYVRQGCEPTLSQSGLAWPTHLNCSLYPSKGQGFSSTLCFGPDDPSTLQTPPISGNISTPDSLSPLWSFGATVLGPTVVVFSWALPASNDKQVNSSFNSTISCDPKLDGVQKVFTHEYESMTAVLLDGFLPTTTYSCSVSVSSIAENISSAMETFTTLSPLQVQFTNNTPVVQSTGIYAQFEVSRSAAQITCNLIPKASDKINCSNGSVTFPSVTPGTYVVRVVSQNSKHDRAVLRRKVVVPSSPMACTVHLINRGVTHDGRNVTLEFTGSGPVTKFTCQLDDGQSYICSSPVVLADLQGGEHQLKIMPGECRHSKAYTAKFSA